jgi:hypothetical protein
VGCQSAHVAQPLTTTLSSNDPDKQSEFWYQLSRRSVASNDDAFHGLILYTQGSDDNADYAGRVKFLKDKKILPASFNRPADEAINRGDLAVAIVNLAHIKGGLTSRLIGPTPRYAVRTLQNEGIYPASSPNMTYSGTEFCGILGKLEDYQRGNPNRAPAEFLPGEIGIKTVVMAPESVDDIVTANTPEPLLLMQAAAPSAPTSPVSLSVIITGVEGPLAQARADENSPWQKAVVGMKLGEKAEFRTGIRSAIRFVIPPDQTFTLDRLGTTKVLQAIYDGKKIKTDVGMETGRVRLDVAPLAANSRKILAASNDVNLNQIEEAGVRHDSTIRSPNSALAVRGTKVSLYDQPPFTPEAVSLTGRAQFENTRRQIVAFGGTAGKTQLAGEDTGAAEAGLRTSTVTLPPAVFTNVYQQRQSQEFTGQIAGSTLIGQSSFPADRAFNGGPSFLSTFAPGKLLFALEWLSGTNTSNDQQKFTTTDLNLAVISPLSSQVSARNPKAAPDFVANPPFLLSEFPNSPKTQQARATFYPEHSLSGGFIGANAVAAPLANGQNGAGVEVASWPANYPVGKYTVAVYNLVDALPGTEIKPINPAAYRVMVFIDGKLLANVTGPRVLPGATLSTIYQKEIQAFQINVPPASQLNTLQGTVSAASRTARPSVLPKITAK